MDDFPDSVYVLCTNVLSTADLVKTVLTMNLLRESVKVKQSATLSLNSTNSFFTRKRRTTLRATELTEWKNARVRHSVKTAGN